jgi:site-specific DNA-methyltransferase (adenine-specific)
MKQFPDGYFDLAIVDPPYGINADSFGMGDGLKGRGRSTARTLQKGRLNAGSGKLKNRVLNQSDCSWDREPPSKEYFVELQRVSKQQIIWGGQLL